MKWSILVGENPYGSTIHFAKGLAHGLTKHGIETTLHWVGEGHFFHAWHDFMRDPPDRSLSFSDIQMEGVSLGAFLPFPHTTIALDPLIYSMHHLEDKKSSVLVVDRADLKFASKQGKNLPVFLPHAVDERWFLPTKKERIYQYQFFGTCIDYRKVEESWSNKYGTQIGILLKEVSRRVLFGGTAISDALLEAGINTEQLLALHHEVDLYVRGRERVELLQAFPGVHVWGDGPWKRYLKEAYIHPAVSFEKSLELMQQAKVVLNGCARFQEVLHERVLYALLMGAFALSSYNPYIAECFSADEGCLLYRKGAFLEAYERAQLADTLSSICVERGREKVLEEHSWFKRVKNIL